MARWAWRLDADSRFFQDEYDLCHPEETSDEPIEMKRADEIFDFNYKPRDIKAHLDRFVIRQDEAKKASPLRYVTITTMPNTCVLMSKSMGKLRMGLSIRSRMSLSLARRVWEKPI